MNLYKSSADLKDLAKEKLNGRYSAAISAVIWVECITYLVSTLFTAKMPANTVPQYLISTAVTAVLSVFVGILQTGISLFYLNMACGQPYALSNIFYGIQNQPGRSLIVSLANVLLNLVCLTPYQVFMMLFLQSDNMIYLMLMFVSAGIGLLVFVPVSLAISQSYFLLLDFPNYTGKQALTASFRLMKHHMGRLFYIQVSFLPLILLSCLSFGLGLLWLTPYMNMTYALFFLDIMNPAKTETH